MDLLFPLLIVFMIGMIFFSNRQRKKQQRQQENLQSSITVGDVVVMTCGVSGTVVDTDDDKTIDLEIAPEVITTWLRAAVREKLSSDVDTAHIDGHIDGHTDGHSLHGDGALESATPTNGATVSTASTNGTPTHGTSTNGTGGSVAASTTDAPTASTGDGGFTDPTAAPSGDGVSAGSSTPEDTRSSS